MKTLFLQENTSAVHQPLIHNIFKARHDTFIERLGWDIPSNGLERDKFDDLSPYHIAIKSANGELKGCWRALPTTGNYMLRSIFPELLQGEELPKTKDVWEISRFTVPKTEENNDNGYIADITLDLFKSFIDFAREKSIKRYITVTSVACERILKRGGMSVERVGEGKAMQIGVERTIALWVDIEARAVKMGKH